MRWGREAAITIQCRLLCYGKTCSWTHVVWNVLYLCCLMLHMYTYYRVLCGVSSPRGERGTARRVVSADNAWAYLKPSPLSFTLHTFLFYYFAVNCVCITCYRIDLLLACNYVLFKLSLKFDILAQQLLTACFIKFCSKCGVDRTLRVELFELSSTNVYLDIFMAIVPLFVRMEICVADRTSAWDFGHLSAY